LRKLKHKILGKSFLVPCRLPVKPFGGQPTPTYEVGVKEAWFYCAIFRNLRGCVGIPSVRFLLERALEIFRQNCAKLPVPFLWVVWGV
jgi:hypothetical protein